MTLVVVGEYWSVFSKKKLTNKNPEPNLKRSLDMRKNKTKQNKTKTKTSLFDEVHIVEKCVVYITVQN